MTVHIELAEHEAATLIAYLRAQQGYGGMTLIDVRSKVERALEYAEEQRDEPEVTPKVVVTVHPTTVVTGGLSVAAPTESELRALSGDR